MKGVSALAALTVVLVVVGVAAGMEAPTGTATNTPALSMKYTRGWDAAVLCEFSAKDDGAFLWKTKNESRSGIIPGADLKALIADVASAGPGPGADDAGEVEFKWRGKDGKAGTRTYSYPGKDPCQRLLNEIDTLTAKHKEGNPK